MTLKDLMDRTLDDVSYLRDYGTIPESLYDAYYYLWYHGIYRYGQHELPENIEAIRATLCPDDLLTFQAYMEKFKILG